MGAFAFERPPIGFTASVDETGAGAVFAGQAFRKFTIAVDGAQSHGSTLPNLIMKTLHEEPGASSRKPKSAHLMQALKPQEREALRAALHDGLGQALTSISFLAGSLQQKLAAQNLPEATDAAEIASLISRAVSQTQALVQEPSASAFQ